MQDFQKYSVGGLAPSGLSIGPALFWSPLWIFLIVAAYVILASISAHHYTQRAFFAQNDALDALATGCFVLAGLMLIPPFRRLTVRHLNRVSQWPLKQHLLSLGLAFAGLMLWWGFIRFCQYRAYLLPTDTSINIQNAYVFLRTGNMDYELWGMKVLSQHISLMMAVWAPFLLIWNNPLTLLSLQNLAICSMPFAAYGIIYVLTSSGLAGCVGMLLTVSTPYIYELLTSNLHIAPLSAFFLWAMFFITLRRWVLAAVFVILMATCNEQVAFIYFGMGLYVMLALRDKKHWNWAWGVGIAAAAAVLWVGEMKIIKYYESLEPELNFVAKGKWDMFRHLVPAGIPSEQVLNEIVSQPFRTIRFFFSSIYVFYPFLRVLFSMGFLCLLAPIEMLPFAVAFFPHLLASPGNPSKFLEYHPGTYFDLGLHHPAYTFGPLVWATAYGIRRAYFKLQGRGWEGLLLAVTLVFAGFGFKYAHRTLHPQWRPPWFDAMPRVMAKIPPRARLWGDEYALAPLSTRRWMRNIMWGPEDPTGYKTLFKPDYALFDKAFVVHAKPPYRDKMLTFFAKNGYKKIADDSGVLLLKAPNISTDPDSEPERIQLPEPDPRAAQSYGQYLLQAPPESE